MCGLVGIVGTSAVNQRIYDALSVLQHRGQDAAGIMTMDEHALFVRKDAGLVRDVFREEDMRQLIGSIVSHFARRAVGLAAMDRLLGVVFGLVRGVVVIGLLVLAGRSANLDTEPWWDKTHSMRAAEEVANWIERYARPAAIELYDEATEKAAT